MAINKDGRFSGAIGDIIVYTVNGKEIKRARPSQVKQTKSMKTSARDFGNIKSISSSLRSGLGGLVQNYKSRPVMFAMDEAVRRWYYDCYLRQPTAVIDPVYFNNLQLTPEAPTFVKPLLGVEPVVDWSAKKKLILHIPEMKKAEMMLPAGATALSFRLVVAGGSMCDREVGKKDYWMKSGPMIKSSDLVEVPLSKTGINGLTIEITGTWQSFTSLYLAFLSVRYKNSKGWIEAEKWKPVVVVGSLFR